MPLRQHADATIRRPNNCDSSLIRRCAEYARSMHQDADTPACRCITLYLHVQLYARGVPALLQRIDKLVRDCSGKAVCGYTGRGESVDC